jgi:hypothetical protein
MELPEGKHHRRALLALFLISAILLAVLRFLAVPYLADKPRPSWDEFSDALLSDLLVGVLVTLLLAIAAYWLLPRPSVRAEVAIVPASERGNVLVEARTDTDQYWFSGSTGRYTRAETLPVLAGAARAANREKEIVLQVIDPTDETLCSAYAAYRNKVRSARGRDEWSSGRTQQEVLATVVLAYAWAREQPLLAIKVALKQSVSLFRFDLGSSLLILTKEDPHEPALQCDSGTFFYSAFLDDMKLSLQQATALDTSVRGPSRDEISSQSVAALFRALGLDERCWAQHLEEIVELARNPRNPYA